MQIIIFVLLCLIKNSNNSYTTEQANLHKNDKKGVFDGLKEKSDTIKNISTLKVLEYINAEGFGVTHEDTNLKKNLKGKRVRKRLSTLTDISEVSNEEENNKNGNGIIAEQTDCPVYVINITSSEHETKVMSRFSL